MVTYLKKIWFSLIRNKEANKHLRDVIIKRIKIFTRKNTITQIRKLG